MIEITKKLTIFTGDIYGGDGSMFGKGYSVYRIPEAKNPPEVLMRLAPTLCLNVNKNGAKVVVFTNCIYFITALNNCIAAGQLFEKFKHDSEKINKIENLLSEGETIAREDIEAFWIENGLYENLIVNSDEYFSYINLPKIDAVSYLMGVIFDNLLDIKYSDPKGE